MLTCISAPQMSLIHAEEEAQLHTYTDAHVLSGCTHSVTQCNLQFILFILFYQFKPTHQRLLVNKMTGPELALKTGRMEDFHYFIYEVRGNAVRSVSSL